MTFDAIRFLQTNIRNESVVFEWGSGGSTIFFRAIADRVITIEHDAMFYSDFSPKLMSRMGHEYLCIPADESPVSDEVYSSHVELGKTFRAYCSAINSFRDATFDVVSVDGRARCGCIRSAIPKIKVGGYLVLDNAERLEYTQGIDCIPPAWKIARFAGCGPYNNYFWHTVVWQRTV